MPAHLQKTELERIRAIANRYKKGAPVRWHRYARETFWICDATLNGKSERIFSTCTLKSFEELWQQGEWEFWKVAKG